MANGQPKWTKLYADVAKICPEMGEHWKNKSDIVDVDLTMINIPNVDHIVAIYKMVKKAVK